MSKGLIVKLKYIYFFYRKRGFHEIPHTDSIRMLMLQAHNAVRNRVALSRAVGPVADMNALAWDYELEEMARV